MRCRALRFSGVTVLCVVTALAGCAGVRMPREKQARQDLKGAESVYVQARPQLPPLTETSTLSDLMSHALMSNPAVASAFYDWKGSVEAITVARSLPDPMLNLSAEVTSALTAVTTALITDPAAGWPGPGKLALRGDAAYEDSQQKRAVFEGRMLDTAVQVKRAWTQAWVVQEQILWTHKALAVVDDMELLARERLVTGKATQQDVIRAQMEKDRLKTDLEDLEDSIKPIHARFKSILGLGLNDTLPDFALRVDPVSPDFTEASLLEVGFERNPRLKQMRSEVLQAVSLMHLARKASVPDFSLGLGVRGSPTTWMPSVGVTVPLWRDKIAAEIAEGRAGVDAAQARLTAEELDLAVRFAETAYAWRQADRTVRLYHDRLVPKARVSLASAQAGYVSGLSGFLDLLEAERTLLDDQVTLTAAVGQREISLAEMSMIVLGQWPAGVATVLPADPTKTRNLP